MTSTTDTIRRRPDGSIDTGYYMARGRQMRAESAFGPSSTSTERRIRHASRRSLLF